MKTWPQAVGVAVLELLATGFCSAAERTQSGLALAYPVDGIKIDGDLSDWPAHLPRYPISFRLLGPLTDPKDCSGEFRVGYSEVENALYVAVEVRDESQTAIGNGPLVLWSNELAVVTIGIDTQEGGHQRLGFLRGGIHDQHNRGSRGRKLGLSCPGPFPSGDAAPGRWVAL